MRALYMALFSLLIIVNSMAKQYRKEPPVLESTTIFDVNFYDNPLWQRDIILYNRHHIDSLDRYGFSALHHAVRIQNSLAIEQLIRTGAKVDIQSTSYRKTTPLLLAIDRNDSLSLATLLEAGVEANYRAEQGKTPLHFAATKCSPQLTTLLLDNYADPLAIDSTGNSALHSALQSGCEELVLPLLYAGADCFSSNTKGEMPLHIAISKNKLKAAELLIQFGAPLDAKDSTFSTPLMLAVKKHAYEMVEILLNAGADISIEDDNGMSVMGYVMRQRMGDKMEQLLLKYGADEYTPLMVAAREGDLQKIIETLDKNASINKTNKYGSSAIIIAASKGHHAIVQELIWRGADPNIINSILGSALMYAVANNNMQICKLLLQNGADVNLINKNGHTALALARKYKRDTIEKLLLEYNALE